MNQRSGEAKPEASNITPDQMILSDQAANVDPGNARAELVSFLEEPNYRTVTLLARKLAAEAYPQYPDAPTYFDRNNRNGRPSVDAVSRFPIFPLSRMAEMDELFSDLVTEHCYPESTLVYGPSASGQIARLVARSDSERAHETLVQHITTPFPEGHRGEVDSDCPGEIKYKTKYLVNTLFGVITYYGTPDSNPWAVRSLADVYRAVKPGGDFYESVTESPESREAPNRAQLEDLQEHMLTRFLKIPAEEINSLVKETLTTEDLGEERIYTILDVLVNREIPARNDDFYDEIIDIAIGEGYDIDAAELLKEYVDCRLDHSTETRRAERDAGRRLSRRIIEVELAKAETGLDSGLQELSFAELAFKMHPNAMKELSEHERYSWRSIPANQEDIDYLLDLVAEPNIGRFSVLAARRVLNGMSGTIDHPKDLEQVKEIITDMLDAKLSDDPNEYHDLFESGGADGVLGGISLFFEPRRSGITTGYISGERLEAVTGYLLEETEKIEAYLEAYREYAIGTYPDYKTAGQVDDGFTRAERGKRYDVRSLERSLETIIDMLKDRSTRPLPGETPETQTNPKKYAEWLRRKMARYNNEFVKHMSTSGSSASQVHREFHNRFYGLAERAKDISDKSGEVQQEELETELVELIAETKNTYRIYQGRGTSRIGGGFDNDPINSNRELYYDKKFYSDLSILIEELIGNMPGSTKRKALEMIRDGEVADFLTKEERAKIQKI